MNQLENCQARYRSNTWMSLTCTDGLDEFEPPKFDCIFLFISIIISLLQHNIFGRTTATHLLFWADRHYQLLHPLLETRLSKIGSIQMTPVGELIMYHGQSFTKESETVASDFSNAD